LQHLLRVFEQILELIALAAQHLSRQLRGHFDPGNRTVFRNEANFVDPDIGVARQCRFQLLRQGTWLGVAAGEGANKARKAGLRGIWCEVNAGDAR